MILLKWLLAANLVVNAAPVHDEGKGVRADYKPVVRGLDYAHLKTTNWNNGEPWSIHIARLDRSAPDLQLRSTLARGTVFGLDTVSDIAKNFPREKGELLAVINAGFCIRTRHTYQGAPRGMVITDGELVSSPGISVRNYAFCVDKKGAMHFAKYEPAFRATLPDGTTVPFGLNNELAALVPRQKPDRYLSISNPAMLYTHMLGRNTRATNAFELVLEQPDGKPLAWSVGNTYRLRVKALNPSGDSALSNTIAVLAFGSEMGAQLAKARPGDPITIELKTTPEIKDVVTSCHAIFPVVQNGKALDEFDADGVILRKNPRTAIGFNDRYFYMVVVDGRQKELSMGMNAQELGEFMHRLGCVEAANLDGGGSSTFWLEGKTRNSVAGSRERDRGDALVITRTPGKTLVTR